MLWEFGENATGKETSKGKIRKEKWEEKRNGNGVMGQLASIVTY